jgi:hypothetical protein
MYYILKVKLTQKSVCTILSQFAVVFKSSYVAHFLSYAFAMSEYVIVTRISVMLQFFGLVIGDIIGRHTQE